MMIAIPWPPPMQAAPIAYLPFLRLREKKKTVYISSFSLVRTLKCISIQTQKYEIQASQATLPELVDQVGRDSRSRGTQRMSDSNRSSVDITFLLVQSKGLSNCQALWGKCLVHLCKAKPSL